LQSIIAVILLVFTVILSIKYTKKLLFGGAFFLITLLPVLQFIPNGLIIVADRYTYMPSIGIFFVISSLICWLCTKKLNHLAGFLLIVPIACIMATLFFLTYNRCKVWKDGITLWGDALKDHDNPFAYSNRAAAYTYKQEYNKAVIDFYKALLFYNNKFGLKQDYKETYKQLLMFGRNYSEIYNFLGVQFATLGYRNEAKFLFINSIKIDPTDVEPYNNLAALLGNLGGYKEAIEVSRMALSIDPNSAKAYYNLAMACYFDRQYQLMIKYMRAAAKLGYNIPSESLELIKSYSIK
jgi:tetratricopeptide (TPR) repeat protein